METWFWLRIVVKSKKLQKKRNKSKSISLSPSTIQGQSPRTAAGAVVLAIWVHVPWPQRMCNMDKEGWEEKQQFVEAKRSSQRGCGPWADTAWRRSCLGVYMCQAVKQVVLESVVKVLPTKEDPELDGFITESYQTFQGKTKYSPPIQNNWKGGNLPIPSLRRASHNFKTRNRCNKKRKLSTNIPDKHRGKISCTKY